MSDLIRLSLTTVDAPDAIALARFYAEITGGVAKGDEYWALVEGPNGDIGFQQIDDYRPPTWPDGEVGCRCTSSSSSTTWRRPERVCWRPALPDSSISPTPTTASRTPTRRGIRSACQRGGSRESATDTISAWTVPR